MTESDKQLLAESTIDELQEELYWAQRNEDLAWEREIAAEILRRVNADETVAVRASEKGE